MNLLIVGERRGICASAHCFNPSQRNMPPPPQFTWRHCKVTRTCNQLITRLAATRSEWISAPVFVGHILKVLLIFSLITAISAVTGWFRCLLEWTQSVGLLLSEPARLHCHVKSCYVLRMRPPCGQLFGMLACDWLKVKMAIWRLASRANMVLANCQTRKRCEPVSVLRLFWLFGQVLTAVMFRPLSFVSRCFPPPLLRDVSRHPPVTR